MVKVGSDGGMEVVGSCENERGTGERKERRRQRPSARPQTAPQERTAVLVGYTQSAISTPSAAHTSRSTTPARMIS